MKKILLLSLILLAAAGCTPKQSTQTPASTTDSATEEVMDNPPSERTKTWKTHTNQEYGFEFKHQYAKSKVTEPLNGYEFSNPPAGTGATYNAQTEKWTASQYGMPDKFTSRTTSSGIKWYLTGIADGLGGSSIALVPDDKHGVMIEIYTGIDFSSPNDPIAEAENTLTDIMSTFKFKTE